MNMPFVAGAKTTRKNFLYWAVICILYAIPVIYVLKKVIYDPPLAANDFKFFWLAGHIWAEGLNPYGEEYIRSGQVFFKGDVIPFFYPPHWYIILRAIASFSFENSLILWRVISMISLLIPILLWVDIFKKRKTSVPHALFLLFFWVTFFSNSTAILVSNGQTSAIICLAVSLYFWAWNASNRIVMTLALWMLVLKPNIGMYFCFVLLSSRYWWPALFAAAVATILSSLPALYPFGILQTITEMALGLKKFELVLTNVPQSMTGFRTLFFYMTGITIPAIWSMVLGFGFGFAVGLFDNRNREAGQGLHNWITISSAALILSLGAFFVPLHTYDLTLLAPLTLLCWGMPMFLRIALCGCMIVFMRAANIALALGLTDPNVLNLAESYFVSLLLLIITVLCAVSWMVTRNERLRLQQL